MKSVLLLLVIITISSAQIQLWYQQPTGNIGPSMSVIVNAQGMIFVSVHQKGIFRSLDTANTWQQVAPFTDGVWSLASAPNGEIIASLWSQGIYRSTNSGNSWIQAASNKLHADIRAVNSSGEIFIEAEGKLFRSSNSGSSWIATSIGANVIALQGDTMYAAKGTSVFRSADNGKQWAPHSALPSNTYALSVEPTGKIVAGTFLTDSINSSSIFSYNGTTHAWNGIGPRSTINALVRRKDGALFAATNDSGFYSSMNNGTSWRKINNGLTTTKIYSLALLSDTIIIAGTLDGIFLTKNLTTVLSVEPDHQQMIEPPAHFILSQNYPNPFNPSTQIDYQLSTRNIVSLKVYDVIGKEIATLVSEIQEAGRYSVPFNAGALPSGIYLYRLHTGDAHSVKKMLLLR
jgi:hypothetical protein